MKKKIASYASLLSILLVCLWLANMLHTTSTGSLNIATASTYAIKMLENYKTIALNSGMQLISKKNTKRSSEYFDIYDVSLSNSLQSYGTCSITYLMNEENESNGFRTEVVFEENDGVLIPIMTALTIASVSPGCDYAQATEIARNWLENYSGKGFSNTLNINDYVFVISSGPGNAHYLNARLRSSVNVSVKKSEYSRLPYEDVRSGSHTTERICVTGVVQKQYTHESETGDIIDYVILISEGKRYRGGVWIPVLPVHFAAGKEYTFYGTVDQRQEDDYACLTISCFEEGLGTGNIKQ